MNFKKWVKSIQTAGYNAARTVDNLIKWVLKKQLIQKCRGKVKQIRFNTSRNMGLFINDFGNGGERCQKLVKLWRGLKNADMEECSDKNLNFKSESYGLFRCAWPLFFFKFDFLHFKLLFQKMSNISKGDDAK